MHALALALAPIVAAETSRVPFYIAAGVLVAWALTVSLVLGLRKPAFPWNGRGQRAVIAITVLLVLVTTSTDVLTSSTPAKSATAAAAPASETTAGK
jgi:drug/metabolite transporter (DMT)-like permease